MKPVDKKIRICPKCGKSYSGRPAISREDNKSMVCEDCGTREALEGLGIDWKEQNKILEIIHEHRHS